MRPSQLFDVRGDVHGLDHRQVASAMPFQPGAQAAHGGGVGAPGVGVADGDDEELEEAVRDLGAGAGDHGGHGQFPDPRDDDKGRLPVGEDHGSLRIEIIHAAATG